MRVRGGKEIRKAGRWLKSRFVQTGLILLYHRVAEIEADNPSDIFSLGITPKHFGEHLSVLRKIGTPISLKEMSHRLKNGNLPHCPIVITFDDCYADNYYQAKPLLDQYEVPATVFVVTGCMGKNFWWDELSHIIFQPKTLPANLSLSVDGHHYACHLDDNREGSRKRIMRSLHQQMRAISEENRQMMLRKLSEWAGVEQNNLENHRSLTTEEIKKLAAGSLIEIGAHTVTHSPLSALSVPKQKVEIVQSKEDLEKILGTQVTSFSYPYGLKKDFTSESVTIVQESGFERACTNVVDVVNHRSRLFELPRFWVRDWSGEELSRRLGRWLHD
ncbi:MAG: polysaccharide deacetylase family protein [Planctomycetota bacterium]|jgi:peptidoglycan/xylan/chitin deacetylase (PgdA/CDA1 family)